MKVKGHRQDYGQGHVLKMYGTIGKIIERTIGLVLGPFTALYRSFLKRCTLTNKAVGTI